MPKKPIRHYKPNYFDLNRVAVVEGRVTYPSPQQPKSGPLETFSFIVTYERIVPHGQTEI